MSEIFWTSWEAVVRAMVLCAGGYAALVVFLRISGKRSTSKLNMFDWAMTVALGSMLASIALSTSIPLAAGIAALATLIGLQYVIAWLTVRSRTLRGVVKAEPSLLYHGGKFLRDRMRKERIAEEEIRAVVREAGYGTMDSIQAVVLETNSEMSILVNDFEGLEAGALEGVDKPDDAASRDRGRPSR